MRRTHTEIGRIKGGPYQLRFDRRGNMQACDPEYEKEWRWFSWYNSNYVGDFKLKREALAQMENGL